MADSVRVYNGPDLKFGRQVIVAGTRFFLNGDDVLLAGHDDFQFLTPAIISSLERNSDDTGESPAQYWPTAYATLQKRGGVVAKPVPAPVEEKILPIKGRNASSRFHYVRSVPHATGPDLVEVSMPGISRHNVNIDVQPITDVLRTGRFASVENIFPPSDKTLQVFQDKVLPYLGLKVDLPMNRIYYAESHHEPTCLVHTTIEGRTVGVVVANLDHMKKTGGYNTWNVGQAFTHECAHYVYHALLRNTARTAFDKACRPSSGSKINEFAGRDGYSFNTEQFAVLAETLVWGNAFRQLDCLNGIEQVMKYFVNNWIPDEDLRDPMAYIK